MYKLDLHTKARKFLKKLSQKHEKERIIEAIQEILNNPLSGLKLQPPLNDCYSYKKCKPYRIIYLFNSKTTKVSVLDIDHRKDVYKIL